MTPASSTTSTPSDAASTAARNASFVSSPADTRRSFVTTPTYVGWEDRPSLGDGARGQNRGSMRAGGGDVGDVADVAAAPRRLAGPLVCRDATGSTGCGCTPS